MLLKSLLLQNFRNYTKADFHFDSGVTVVVGANASGKSNLIESIYLLATGNSRRTDQDKQLIHFGDSFCRVRGVVSERVDDGQFDEELEAVISSESGRMLRKKYLVNGVGKRRVDFAGKIIVVLFTPLDLEIVVGQPSMRRRFLDEVLEQVDYQYRLALTTYTKALRQRNALLEQAQKIRERNERLFAYWDELIIKNGQIISSKRGALVDYINKKRKDLFDFILEYDRSIITEARLLEYRDAELGAGVTLVGPHRDEVKILARQGDKGGFENVKHFSSRGQQRLVVLELKLSQILYITEKLAVQPLLLLDDIFSELDNTHIGEVLEMVKRQQTIITTTHEEFVRERGISVGQVIELEKNMENTL